MIDQDSLGFSGISESQGAAEGPLSGSPTQKLE
jgi:hypothetical protein